MSYTVTITLPNGHHETHPCGGVSDQEAMIYAGKVVEDKAGGLDPNAKVTIERDGTIISSASTVREITQKPRDIPGA